MIGSVNRNVTYSLIGDIESQYFRDVEKTALKQDTDHM